jgi:hypothetical protein
MKAALGLVLTLMLGAGLETATAKPNPTMTPAPSPTAVVTSASRLNFDRATAKFSYCFRVDAHYKTEGGRRFYASPFKTAALRQQVFYNADASLQYVRVLSATDISAQLQAECDATPGCQAVTVEQLQTELSAGRVS